MKKLLVVTTYKIKLSEESFTRIIHKDHTTIPNTDNLHLLLNRIEGISDVDYSGHYGPVIILTLEAEHDTDLTWDNIKDTINMYRAK